MDTADITLLDNRGEELDALLMKEIDEGNIRIDYELDDNRWEPTLRTDSISVEVSELVRSGAAACSIVPLSFRLSFTPSGPVVDLDKPSFPMAIQARFYHASTDQVTERTIFYYELIQESV